MTETRRARQRIVRRDRQTLGFEYQVLNKNINGVRCNLAVREKAETSRAVVQGGIATPCTNGPLVNAGFLKGLQIQDGAEVKHELRECRTNVQDHDGDTSDVGRMEPLSFVGGATLGKREPKGVSEPNERSAHIQSSSP
jgi:hypothetical protein